MKLSLLACGWGALLSLAWSMNSGSCCAADPVGASSPRATMGDAALEPLWDQRLTVTVGPAGADLVGTTDKTIQAAVEYVTRFGGGTVKLLPGTYRLRNAVYLQSKLRLLGSGTQTLLIKEPSRTVALAQDGDAFDQEITLADASGFDVGDGVCLQAKAPQGSAAYVASRTLVARSGNRFKLDQGLQRDFWRSNQATVSTVFPLLSAENIADSVVENMVLDGSRGKNAKLDGGDLGGLFLQGSSRITIRGVTARNYNGDGIVWLDCHDVRVENCTVEGNARFGLHPGSGSQRPVIRNNRLVGNHIGLFFCWGVRNGIAEGNHIEGNRVGVSIGHRDTDNRVIGNQILRNSAAGVLFRSEPVKDFAGHRNRIEKNRLVDNGPEQGFAVDVQGATESIVLADNDIQDTRGAARRTAIRLGPETRDITLRNNRFQGFAEHVRGPQGERGP